MLDALLDRLALAVLWVCTLVCGPDDDDEEEDDEPINM